MSTFRRAYKVELYLNNEQTAGRTTGARAQARGVSGHRHKSVSDGVTPRTQRAQTDRCALEVVTFLDPRRVQRDASVVPLAQHPVGFALQVCTARTRTSVCPARIGQPGEHPPLTTSERRFECPNQADRALLRRERSLRLVAPGFIPWIPRHQTSAGGSASCSLSTTCWATREIP
jgi:hypothetical protein